MQMGTTSVYSDACDYDDDYYHYDYDDVILCIVGN